MIQSHSCFDRLSTVTQHLIDFFFTERFLSNQIYSIESFLTIYSNSEQAKIQCLHISNNFLIIMIQSHTYFVQTQLTEHLMYCTQWFTAVIELKDFFTQRIF